MYGSKSSQAGAITDEAVAALRATVVRRYGVTLDERAAQTALKVADSVRRGVDATAAYSLFDTEPSQLESVLTALTEPARDDDSGANGQ